MTRRISDRLASLEPSATLAVDAKAKALRAMGEPVIGFGVGEPDFPTPAHIVDAAAKACYDVVNHKYSPTGGLPELREAIAYKSKRDSGLEVASNQVLVTNGAKHAVATAFASLLDPGDEVLIPAPFWTTYPESVRLSGGVPVIVPTSEASGFHLRVADLEAAVTSRTKVVLFVSPCNPTGAVVAPDEVAAIGRWAADRGLWVVCDEIYEHLVYGESRQVSLPVVAPEVGDRWIVINGVAKTYAMTGWRIGWMIAPPDITAAATDLLSQTTSNISNISQRAAVVALNGDLGAVAEMREAFDRRRRTMTKMLNEIDGVHCREPEGAFYCFPNVSGLLGRPLRAATCATSAALAAHLLEEIKIAVVPGEAFGAPGYFRLSYALGDDDIVDGLERFRHYIAD
jgi:aspartate aminotransferase